MGLLSSLKREQKTAFGLLQFGTFLEYFDLSLYVHMGVVLNALFFPQSDSHTAALLSALAFCSTFVVRPFGALIIGYVGDTIGRKTTVVLTTLLMALSCVIMASLPTYSQIGISAAWFMILCRILQGFSSMGEIVGAEIYLTEMIKTPLRYPVVASLRIVTGIGIMVAIFIAAIVTSQGFNWRIAFWIGAIIAVVGTAARTHLRETPDFIDMKRRMKRAIEDAEEQGLTKAANMLKTTNPILKEKTSKKTTLAYFFMECASPLFFFMSYIYMANVLKDTFGYTPHQIIQQNLMVIMISLGRVIFFTYMSSKVHPLKLLRIQLIIFSPFILIYPYVLINHPTVLAVFIFQAYCIFFSPLSHPAAAVFYAHFPVFRRFTYTSFIFAMARAFVHVISSFGLIYITAYLDHWGLLVITLPILVGFGWGLRHFEKLERNLPESGHLNRKIWKPEVELKPALKTGT